MDPKERITQLTAILTEANYRYYVLDDPELPDFEYDRLLRELEDLEAENPEFASPNSPTKRVGGEALSKFEKVKHPVPLMSLQDVFSYDELTDFIDKILENLLLVHLIKLGLCSLGLGYQLHLVNLQSLGNLR